MPRHTALTLSPKLTSDSVETGDGLDESILDQASDWLVKLWSGSATAEDHQACASWRAAHADHERAWKQLQTIDQKLDSVPRELAGMVLKPHSYARRRTLKLLIACSVGGAATYTATRTAVWQRYAADYHTAIGETRSVVLADSTQVDLNTASAIDIRYNTRQRDLRLRGGEILVSTASDSAPIPRPFSVTTAQGLIQAFDTRFTVREVDDDLSDVSVLQGAVSIQPREPSQGITRLEAGQQATFSANRVGTIQRADQDSSAWSRGLLIVEQMRLGEFVRTLSRYRAGILRCAPAVADLELTGVYPLADTDRILAAVARALPVRIEYQTRYWVTIASR